MPNLNFSSSFRNLIYNKIIEELELTIVRINLDAQLNISLVSSVKITFIRNL